LVDAPSILCVELGEDEALEQVEAGQPETTVIHRLKDLQCQAAVAGGDLDERDPVEQPVDEERQFLVP
jgi:hypothetical protein